MATDKIGKFASLCLHQTQELMDENDDEKKKSITSERYFGRLYRN
jgi:hypothetical protein